MHALRRTATVLIGPAIASLGAACDRLDAPTAEVQYGLAAGGPGKATGGGQIDIVDATTGATIGTASFGFNGKQAEAPPGTVGAVSGHLNYVNHVTGVHLNCEIETGGVTPAHDDVSAMASFGGYECTPNSTYSDFTFTVTDVREPGRDDKFRITYDGVIDEGAGSPIRSGNIQVHK